MLNERRNLFEIISRARWTHSCEPISKRKLDLSRAPSEKWNFVFCVVVLNADLNADRATPNRIQGLPTKPPRTNHNQYIINYTKYEEFKDKIVLILYSKAKYFIIFNNLEIKTKF
jgi:hypothetical protein